MPIFVIIKYFWNSWPALNKQTGRNICEDNAVESVWLLSLSESKDFIFRLCFFKACEQKKRIAPEMLNQTITPAIGFRITIIQLSKYQTWEGIYLTHLYDHVNSFLKEKQSLLETQEEGTVFPLKNTT